MTDIKVYQLGLGNFGRHGFEKFVEMHKHLETVDVKLVGLAEKDHEKRKAAEKFAEANGIEIQTFRKMRDFYKAAADEDGDVLVYDASPSQSHAENIYSSINNDLFHVAEKPPSLTREEHIKERKLAADRDVFWKVDFIERESPVVKKAVKELQGEDIDSIEVFRESTVGIQKMLNPVRRTGVAGGDILDKMTHEIYIFDLLQAAGEDIELEFQDGEAEFFMPARLSSDKMMNIYGGTTDKIDGETATARSHGRFGCGDVDIVLNSSWIGCTSEAGHWEQEIPTELIESGFKVEDEKGFLDEEARFFVVTGSRDLLGDMLHGRLFDLETGELIQTPDLMHDQLYRVLRKAVEQAADHKETRIDRKEIDEFMTGIFDLRAHVTENAGEFFEELQKSNERVSRMMADNKIIEDSESETVTG